MTHHTTHHLMVDSYLKVFWIILLTIAVGNSLRSEDIVLTIPSSISFRQFSEKHYSNSGSVTQIFREPDVNPPESFSVSQTIELNEITNQRKDGQWSPVTLRDVKNHTWIRHTADTTTSGILSKHIAYTYSDSGKIIAEIIGHIDPRKYGWIINKYVLAIQGVGLNYTASKMSRKSAAIGLSDLGDLFSQLRIEEEAQRQYLHQNYEIMYLQAMGNRPPYGEMFEWAIINAPSEYSTLITLEGDADPPEGWIFNGWNDDRAKFFGDITSNAKPVFNRIKSDFSTVIGGAMLDKNESDGIFGNLMDSDSIYSLVTAHSDQIRHNRVEIFGPYHTLSSDWNVEKQQFDQTVYSKTLEKKLQLHDNGYIWFLEQYHTRDTVSVNRRDGTPYTIQADVITLNAIKDYYTGTMGDINTYIDQDGLVVSYGDLRAVRSVARIEVPPGLGDKLLRKSLIVKPTFGISMAPIGGTLYPHDNTEVQIDEIGIEIHTAMPDLEIMTNSASHVGKSKTIDVKIVDNAGGSAYPGVNISLSVYYGPNSDLTPAIAVTDDRGIARFTFISYKEGDDFLEAKIVYDNDDTALPLITKSTSISWNLNLDEYSNNVVPEIPACLECPTPLGQLTAATSRINNLQFSHHHDARDYVGNVNTSACSPCGGGSKTTLRGMDINRTHRYRDIDKSSSLGPGVFLDIDKTLTLNLLTNELEYFDPKRLDRDHFSAFGSGMYVDYRRSAFKGITLNDAAGHPVDNPLLAVSATLTHRDNSSEDYEMYYDAAAKVMRGRMIADKDQQGNSIQIHYSHDRTNYNASNFYKISEFIDRLGMRFTCNTSWINGRYAITDLHCPDGKNIVYKYNEFGMIGLSSIEYANGDKSKVGMKISNDDKVLSVIITDAGAEGIHRNKTLRLSLANDISVSPPIQQASNCVRQVLNGAGELTYRNWYVPSYNIIESMREYIDFEGNVVQEVIRINEDAVFIYDGGSSLMCCIFVDDIPKSTYRARDWDITGDPHIFQWDLVESYVIDGYQRVIGVTRADLYYDQYVRDHSTGSVTNESRINPSTGAFIPGVSTTYNTERQVLSQTDALGYRALYIYDDQGNRLSSTQAQGTPSETTVSWTYNDRGQPLTMTDERGNVTTYTYDANGLPLTVTSPPDHPGDAQATRTVTYNAAGLMATSTDALGRTAQYTYDARNRVSRIDYANGSFESFLYGTSAETANLLLEHRNRNGNRTITTYDGAGRTIAVTTADAAGNVSGVVQTSYLPGTQLVSSETRDGALTTYAYDHRKRAVQTARQVATDHGMESLTTTMTYDPADRIVAQTDAFGRRTLSVYDDLDRVVRSVRELISGGVPSNGDPATLERIASANPPYLIEDSTYDAGGRVLTSTDGRGIVSSYVYDAMNRVTARTEAVGTPIEATTHFEYDAAGNQVRVVDPRGVATVMTYTGRNLLASATVADGTAVAGTMSKTYTPTGKLATQTDALGRTKRWTYGVCCDWVATTIDEADFVIANTYTGGGLLAAVTDANGLVTTMTYDSRDRPLTRTNAAGETTTYSYDENLTDGVGVDALATSVAGLGFGPGDDGSAVVEVNPLGERRTMIRDALDRVVRTIDGNGHATTMHYDVLETIDGQALVKATTTDALGHTTSQYVDAGGRVRVTVDALGKINRFGYDANGNVVSVRDANGVGHDCVFDARNRQLECTDTAGSVTRTRYDASGNVVETVDALGHSSLIAYDARNRKTQMTDRVGAVTKFQYDLNDNLLEIEDGDIQGNGRGGITSYQYDARRLLVSETFPGATGGTRTYSYDPGQRLRTRTDQTGLVTTYDYDAANRLIARRYSDHGGDDLFGYDHAGRMLTATAQRYGTTVDRQYDPAGRLSQETQQVAGRTGTVRYGYDADNRKTSATYPNGKVATYGFSDRNELTAMGYDGAGVATRNYDDGMRLTKTTFANGVIEDRTYIPGDRLVKSILANGPQGPVTGFRYRYDANKRKTLEEDTVMSAWSQSFAYDPQDRLIDWKQGPPNGSGGIQTADRSQTWDLSKVGDWKQTVKDGVTETRTHTPVHELTGINRGTGLIPLTYDAKGNLTSDDRGQQYFWDPENRLARAMIPQQAGTPTEAANPGGWARYTYDALGRRLAKTWQGVTTIFWHDGAQVIQESDVRPGVSSAEATSDGSLANGSLSPGETGGILSGAVLHRINFQPAASPIPQGYLADKGRGYALRTNSLTYGWKIGAVPADRTSTARQRNVLTDPAPDSFVGMVAGSATASWSIAVPNGLYPVAIVTGDVASMESTNHLLVNDEVWNDPDPGGGNNEYEHGDLDGWVKMVLVTDGTITIVAQTGAVLPKLCLIEIGAEGGSVTVSDEARLNARLNAWSDGIGAGQQIAVSGERAFVYGSYVNEVLSTIHHEASGNKREIILLSNSNYNAVVSINTTAETLEKYKYEPFGNRAVYSSFNVPLAGSTIFQNCGFSGYRIDRESQLLYAHRRMYSPNSGRFISRDPLMYIDGQSLYSYTNNNPINKVDPYGLSETWEWSFGSFWEKTLTLVTSPVHILFDIGAFPSEAAIKGYYGMVQASMNAQTMKTVQALGLNNGQLAPGPVTAGPASEVAHFGQSAAEFMSAFPGTTMTGPVVGPTRVGYVPPILTIGDRAAVNALSTVGTFCDGTRISAIRWYHGTSSKRLESLMNGLSVDPIKAVGGDARGLFLTSDRAVAQMYAKSAAMTDGGEPVVVFAEGRLVGSLLDTVPNPAGGEMMIPATSFRKVPVGALKKDLEATVSAGEGMPNVRK